MRGLKGLGLLLVVLAAAYLGVLAITSVERIRRTAEATIQIDARRPYTTVSTFGTSYLGGWDVSYSYEVAGRTYRSTARRPWPDFDAYEPKVCFAPANPSDHWLVAGTYPCGSVLASGVD
jgi:hypothetical protein